MRSKLNFGPALSLVLRIRYGATAIASAPQTNGSPVPSRRVKAMFGPKEGTNDFQNEIRPGESTR